MESITVISLIIGGSMALCTLILTVASFLHRNSDGYTEQLLIRIKDAEERFRQCHEERQSLESENRRLRQQNMELMLTVFEKKD